MSWSDGKTVANETFGQTHGVASCLTYFYGTAQADPFQIISPLALLFVLAGAEHEVACGRDEGMDTGGKATADPSTRFGVEITPKLAQDDNCNSGWQL